MKNTIKINDLISFLSFAKKFDAEKITNKIREIPTYSAKYLLNECNDSFTPRNKSGDQINGRKIKYLLIFKNLSLYSFIVGFKVEKLNM
tara:strand:+ start:190 stop:456 length:267 start_codon:yes stop_codon:yes gene_type:complete